MIDCEVAKQLMPDYVIGITDEKVKAELEEHIQSCDECSKRLDDLKQAGQEYDIKSAEPLKKVKKVIKNHKRGKIIAIIGAIILAGVLAIFIIGEVNPKSKLPSITRMRYKSKAKQLAEDFCNNNMESLISGYMDNMSGTDAFKYGSSKTLKDMIIDYTDRLTDIYEEYFNGMSFRIDNINVSYKNWYQSYAQRMHPYDEDYKSYGYEAYVYLYVNGLPVTMTIGFINENDYDVSFLMTKSGYVGEFVDHLEEFNAVLSHLMRYARGMDWYKYILDSRMKQDVTQQNNEFVGLSKRIVSSDCHKAGDESYIEGFNERLEQIYYASTTESVYVEALDYNKEEHAINVELIWTIYDKNGNAAVMKKRLLHGSWSYQEADPEETIIAEEGFDPELDRMLRDLF